MKNRLIPAAIFAAATMLAACDRATTPAPEWDYSVSSADNISVEYTPQYYVQLTVKANRQAGEAVITCTNYSVVSFGLKDDDNLEYANPECGFVVSKAGPNAICIHFDEIERVDDKSYDAIALWARSSDRYTTSQILVYRTDD